MDKAFIFGGYGFLGFNLCEAFLEKGIEVHCLYLPQDEDLFLEQKRFSVGRNSNFNELSQEQSEYLLTKSEEKLLIVISCYDYYMKNDASNALLHIEETFRKAFKRKGPKNWDVLFLLPVQFLEKKTCKYIEFFENHFENLIHNLHDRGVRHRSIYLPTLFGPWQSEEFVFQQFLLNEISGAVNEKLRISDKEWIYDAIYVVDAIKEILKEIEVPSNEEAVYFRSSHNTWQKCAKYLSIHSEIYKNQMLKKKKLSASAPAKQINESIGYEQGLLLQKIQLVRILEEI